MSANLITKNERFLAADGIRGFAVLIVLIVHNMVMFFPDTYEGLAGSGKIGVWLFFVLSAFLLTNTFIVNGFTFNYIKSYFIGRFIRIIPLYIITLIIYYFFHYFSFEDAYKIFKLNYPWGHLWTIAVEFKFYFILPLIAYLLVVTNNRFGVIGTLLSAVAIIAVQQFIYPYYMVKPSSTDMIGYISAFVPGMVTAIILATGNNNKNLVSDIIGTVVLAGVLLSVPGLRKIFFGIPNDGYLLDKHVHFAMVWGLFVYFTLSSTGIINKLFSFTPLRLLGKWSFSIYLFHWLVYTQITQFHAGSHLWSLIAFFSAIFVGAIIFVIIEKPMERLRHRVMKTL